MGEVVTGEYRSDAPSVEHSPHLCSGHEFQNGNLRYERDNEGGEDQEGDFDSRTQRVPGAGLCREMERDASSQPLGCVWAHRDLSRRPLPYMSAIVASVGMAIGMRREWARRAGTQGHSADDAGRVRGEESRAQSYLMCMPEMARATIRRWISEVPSKIV
jgi:hypothetical protein